MLQRTLIIAILALPIISEAAPRTFQDLAALAINLLNGGIGIVLILGIVVYFFGVTTSIPKMGEGDMARLRAYFVWGIIALFMMFSVWGILALLRNTLFGGGAPVIGNGGGKQVICSSPDDCRIVE